LVVNYIIVEIIVLGSKMIPETRGISKVKFSIPSSEEIRTTLSAVELTNPLTTVEFTENNTLFDTRMGAFRNVLCGTCKGTTRECPGHHGRIKLTYPCVNIRFINSLMRPILSSFCMGCYKALTRCGCVEDIGINTNKRKRQPKKNPMIIKLTKESNGCGDNKYLQGIKYKFSWAHLNDNSHLTIKEVYDMMNQIPRHEYIELFPQFENFAKITEGPFIHYLLVLPTVCRPPNMMRGEWKMDHMSRSYVEVIKKNINLAMTKDLVISPLVEEYHNQLQGAIDILIDVSQTNNKLRLKDVENGGLRQRIDSKSGRLRTNLMGKRTDFSARTVLSGDPKLGINEIGVPRRIAENLTIPVVVNDYNRGTIYGYKLKYLIKKDGKRYDLQVAKNVRIDIGDTVERCLVDGDVVGINRQPTLHRGSVIGCYVRIFDCLTFRLNYSTMITLNADTDGDEINMHVQQDLESRAELEVLMLASTNIVSSQASKPLIGCTQDSLLGCYLLSKQNELPIHDYMAILFEMGLDDPIFDDRATLTVKGTRIITAILESIGMKMNRYEPNPKFLLIDNVIQYGLLDKNIVGKADNSIIHHVFLTLGHLKAAKLIHLLQIAATTFLDMTGFSVGISDCIVENEQINFEGLEDHLRKDFFKRGGKWTGEDEDELTEALSELTKLEPPKNMGDNRLLDMIVSGAKGSISNFNQITRVVGQQIEAEGRVSKRFSGETRTMPHFSKYDMSAGSRGLVKNSFIKGLSPHEFFFHAMGGRIGLIDTACKTSETGAQSRRLIKVMEPLVTKDFGDGEMMVVNNITNQIVQFAYGEDNYDGTFLKRLKVK
jgi:DNA-directed RNA polymerase II subunit RPB1